MSPTPTGRFLALGETHSYAPTSTLLNHQSSRPSPPPLLRRPLFTCLGIVLFLTLLRSEINCVPLKGLICLGPPLTLNCCSASLEPEKRRQSPRPPTDIAHRPSYHLVFDHSTICDCEGYCLVYLKVHLPSPPSDVVFVLLSSCSPIPPSPARKVDPDSMSKQSFIHLEDLPFLLHLNFIT